MTRPRFRWRWAGAALVACGLLAVPASDYYYRSSRGKACASCHEIQGQFDAWRHSTHRKLDCSECHDSNTMENVERVSTHLSNGIPERIRISSGDVLEMADKCRACHQQEFAQWSSGAHSMTFSRAFANTEHNKKRLLMDDCLRCHGMHFDGWIGNMVQPVDTKGPWKLVDPAMANRPAIPCLSCHAIHREGQPMSRPAQRVSAQEEVVRPSLGLFDRRTGMNIRASALPLPVIFDGERRVRTSPDQRQALCYQCHAPLASAQAGSGDDRTPLGIHEGISCLGCHQNHSQKTRQSCSSCHPRLSNCGLDVEKMDTTFVNPKSTHNIHTAKCTGCHTKGVPKRREREDERR